MTLTLTFCSYILQPNRHFICFIFQRFLLYLTIANFPCISFLMSFALADYLVEIGCLVEHLKAFFGFNSFF